MSLAFLFSFVATVTIEMPIVNTFKVFALDQQVFVDHLYDFTPFKQTKKKSSGVKGDLGRTYEHLMKGKDSNSNSTGSDGAESLDSGSFSGNNDSQVSTGIQGHVIIPQRKQEYRTFVEPLRMKKEEQEHFALIDPINSVADAEKVL